MSSRAPIKISGQPVANLVASTSGTDSDWVVKLIDVYPDEVAAESWMGGYELMISADIFRGRYRESLENRQSHRRAMKPLPYRFALPNANHVFSARATASWCKSSPAGSRCTTEIRKRSYLIFSGRSRKTIAKQCNACTMLRARNSFIELPLVQKQ